MSTNTRSFLSYPALGSGTHEPPAVVAEGQRCDVVTVDAEPEIPRSGILQGRPGEKQHVREKGLTFDAGAVLRRQESQHTTARTKDTMFGGVCP